MSTTSLTLCQTQAQTQTQTLKCCLDPLLFEPRDSLHPLTPPKHALSFIFPRQPSETDNKGLEKNTEQIYVHPLVRRSSSSLSTKSLEMCTESLGSETGNDIISDFDEFSRHYAFEKPSLHPAKKNRDFAMKTKRSIDFPPPLTSISGDENVQVRAHRENGRLVIKAFNFSSARNLFRAERENGRLRLSLLRGGHEADESVEKEEEEQQQNGEEDNAENDTFDGGDEGEFEGRCWGKNGGKIGCKINGGDWPSLPFRFAISS
ncbi:Protein FANTASTIC FOUR 3 [Striga hermonthica]|uniref:Protein FANTASTIC FOUR 3 n=1 Tax=Striga hermonthica TaxID=68872 RepID=A0A9N7NCQ4_STRHE|nr:Protein FANTASTIC FOUR 3 [Striga hermonthica]